MAIKLRISAAIDNISPAHVIAALKEGTYVLEFTLDDINTSTTTFHHLDQMILDLLVQEKHRIKYGVEYSLPGEGALSYDIDQTLEQLGIKDSCKFHVRLTCRDEERKDRGESSKKRAHLLSADEAIATRLKPRDAAVNARQMFPDALKRQSVLDRQEKKRQKKDYGRRREKNQSKKTTSTKTNFKNAGNGRVLGSNGDDETSATGGGVQNSKASGTYDAILANLEARGYNDHPTLAATNGVMDALLQGLQRVDSKVRTELQSALMSRQSIERMHEAVMAVENNMFSFRDVDRDKFYSRTGHRLGREGEDDNYHNNYRIVEYHRLINATKRETYNTIEFWLFDVDVLKTQFKLLYDTTKHAFELTDREWELRHYGRTHCNTFADVLEPDVVYHKLPDHFWSLVYHCNRKKENKMSYYKDMLMKLLPELDWSFLGKEGRKDKAREINERKKDTILLK